MDYISIQIALTPSDNHAMMITWADAQHQRGDTGAKEQDEIALHAAHSPHDNQFPPSPKFHTVPASED